MVLGLVLGTVLVMIPVVILGQVLIMAIVLTAPLWSKDSVLDHRSLPSVFESRRGHIWWVFHLWLRFITFGSRSVYLAYHVHKSGRKSSMNQSIIISFEYGLHSELKPNPYYIPWLNHDPVLILVILLTWRLVFIMIHVLTLSAVLIAVLALTLRPVFITILVLTLGLVMITVLTWDSALLKPSPDYDSSSQLKSSSPYIHIELTLSPILIRPHLSHHRPTSDHGRDSAAIIVLALTWSPFLITDLGMALYCF